MSLPLTDQARPLEQPVPSSANNAISQPVPAVNRNRFRIPYPSRLMLPAAVLIVVLGGAGVWSRWFRGSQVRAGQATARAEFKDLQVRIIGRGSLEAKESRDVKCEVKTGSRGAA